MSSNPFNSTGQPLPQQPQYAYPYAQHQQVQHQQVQPQQQQFVPAEQLAPVHVPAPEPPAEQLWYAPVAPVRDQSRNTLAAVITFAALIIALWGILGFLSSMSKTLSHIDRGTTQLKGQLTTANVGLEGLDEKTGHLGSLATDSTALKGKLGAIDTGMGSMLGSINQIASDMQSLQGSLGNLDDELGKLNGYNDKVSGQLGDIHTGLTGQRTSVAAMAKDVKGTGDELGMLPPRLAQSNMRLKHINSVVNFMGCKGILQKLHATFYLGPISNGSGDISATIVPPGAWGTNANGSPCQQ